MKQGCLMKRTWHRLCLAALCCLVWMWACPAPVVTPPPPPATPQLPRAELDDANGLVLVLSKQPDVRIQKLGFRVQIDGTWIGSEAFGKPDLQKKGDETVVSFPGPAGASIKSVALTFGQAAKNAHALRIHTSITGDGKPHQVGAFELILPEGGVQLPEVKDALLVLHHGYQSWSFTGAVRLEAPFVSPVVEDSALWAQVGTGEVTTERKGISWWFGVVAPTSGATSLLAGALTANRWRTALLASLNVAEKPELRLRQGTSGDALTLSADQPLTLETMVVATASTPRDVLAQYAEAIGLQTPPLPASSVSPTGWWSWNIFFNEVTAQNLLDHAAFLKKDLHAKGFQMIELDDGYQQAWGMWETYLTDKFPGGLPAAVEKLRNDGFVVGLWLAPFYVDTNTTLAQQHPEWMLKDENGAPILDKNIGQPERFVLDVTHPEVEAHIKGLFGRLAAMGISLFKLDFLYAGARLGKRHRPDVTGIEALHLMLKYVREAAPNAHINLCGMPILPAIGRGHSMRVGPDIAFKGFPLNFKTLAHQARNVMLRGFLQPLIRIDPDQVLTRAPLQTSEARVAATLGAMTSFYTLGDDLTALEKERFDLATHPDILAIAAAGKAGVAIDSLQQTGDIIASPVLDLGAEGTPKTVPPAQHFLSIDENTAYLALYNWTNEPRIFDISLQTLMPKLQQARDIWSQNNYPPQPSTKITVAPHDVALLKLQTSP